MRRCRCCSRGRAAEPPRAREDLALCADKVRHVLHGVTLVPACVPRGPMCAEGRAGLTPTSPCGWGTDGTGQGPGGKRGCEAGLSYGQKTETGLAWRLQPEPRLRLGCLLPPLIHAYSTPIEGRTDGWKHMGSKTVMAYSRTVH